MNEKHPFADFRDRIRNDHGIPIDPSRLNPNNFIDGVAPVIFEPRIVTIPSGTGKVPNTIAFIDGVVQNVYPEGAVFITRDAAVSLPEVSETTNQSTSLQQASLKQALGRIGRISS